MTSQDPSRSRNQLVARPVVRVLRWRLAYEVLAVQLLLERRLIRLTSGSRLMNGSWLCGSDSGPKIVVGQSGGEDAGRVVGVAASSPRRRAARSAALSCSAFDRELDPVTPAVGAVGGDARVGGS